jgi:hypothetical protein
MSERMFDDLSAWEAGALSLATLEQRYGREPVHAIIDLHESLSSIASEPVPDASAGWLMVLERMEAPRPAKSGRAHGVLAGALVAAVLSASAAFAAPGAFHAIVDGVRHGVHAVFGGNDGRISVPPSPGPTGPGAIPSSSNGVGKGTGGDGSDSHGGGSGSGGQGSGSGGQGSGSGDQGFGSGDQGSGSGDQGSGSGDQGSGSGDQGAGSGDQGSGSGDKGSGSGDQGSVSGDQGSGSSSGGDRQSSPSDGSSGD